MTKYDRQYVSLIVLLAKFELIKIKSGQMYHVLTQVYGGGALLPPCSIPLPMIDLHLNYITVLMPGEE